MTKSHDLKSVISVINYKTECRDMKKQAPTEITVELSVNKAD